MRSSKKEAISHGLAIVIKYARTRANSMANQPEHEVMEAREPNTIYVGKKPTNR